MTMVTLRGVRTFEFRCRQNFPCSVGNLSVTFKSRMHQSPVKFLVVVLALQWGRVPIRRAQIPVVRCECPTWRFHIRHHPQTLVQCATRHDTRTRLLNLTHVSSREASTLGEQREGLLPLSQKAKYRLQLSTFRDAALSSGELLNNHHTNTRNEQFNTQRSAFALQQQ